MGWGGKGKGWGKSWAPVWQPMWGKGKGKGKSGGMRDFPTEKKVWIGGAPDPCDFKALLEHMKQAGSAVFVSVSKGQGGCAFKSAEDAQNAIATLNGSVFGGVALQVDVWTKKEQMA